MSTELSSSHEVKVTYHYANDEYIEQRPLFRHELAAFDECFGRGNLWRLQEIKVAEDGVVTYWWFEPPAHIVNRARGGTYYEYELLCQGAA